MRSTFSLLALCLLASLAVGCDRSPSQSYDLFFEGVTHKPTNVRVGDKVTFTYVVQNGGTATIPAGSWAVELLVNNKRVTFDEHTSELPPSGPGAIYTMDDGSYHFEATTPSEVPYKLILTTKNELTDADQSNNVVEGTIEILERADVPNTEAS